MQPSDIAMLHTHMKRLYGDRYPGITTEMAELWYEHLRSFPAPIVTHALKRWAAAHQPYQPPTLTDLVTQAEDLQAEQRRQRAAEGHRATFAPGERDDDFSSAEVRALIHSVWPEMFPGPRAPLQEEKRAARIERHRAQAREILAETEPLYEPRSEE